MVNALNDYFTTVCPSLVNDIPNSMNLRNPNIYLSSRAPHSFLLATTASQELSDTIKALNCSKSSGPTSIPTKCLKL